MFKPLGDALMPTDDDRGVVSPGGGGREDEPGVYVVPVPGEAGRRRRSRRAELTSRPDYRALPYNVDALAEGNLARANTDDVTQIAEGPAAHRDRTTPTTTRSVAKKRDLSENPWLYFVILCVLIFEQAMAVRLSFHTRPAEGGPVPAWASRRWRDGDGL